MRTRTVILTVILALLAIFTFLNLGAILAPTTLSLGFTQVQAPLGIVLLGFTAVLATLFLAFVVYVQADAMMESRRFRRELESQRTLADQAEASRFNELRVRVDAVERQVNERLDRLDRDFGAALERTESAIAAYVGELDQRLHSGTSPRAAP